VEEAAARLTEIGWKRDEARLQTRACYEAGLAELLAGASAADLPDDGGALTKVATLASPRPLEMHRLVPWPGFEQRLAAVWSFSADDPPSLAGGAVGAEGTDVDLRREGSDPPSLLLGRIGTSAVALELDFRPAAEAEWSLIVLGQASARRYLPYQGLVRLELFLDGHWVGTQSLSHIGKDFEEFEIPAAWLDPGRHVLTLRLGAESTTSYRLLQARVEACAE
jgi:hypothetical protein